LAAVAFTVAVKVTDWLKRLEAREETTVVVVALLALIATDMPLASNCELTDATRLGRDADSSVSRNPS